ncbi:MAG: ABC transporter permease, partial [Bacteroidota bacterium]
IETENGNTENSGSFTYQGIAVEAKQAIPEVLNYTRFNKGVERLVTVTNEAGETISYNENGIFTVDSAFLHMFTLRLVQGSQEKALAVPYSAVITRSTAKRYFGNKDPVGEIVTSRVSWGKKMEQWTVTGVVENPPSNSILQFNILLGRPVNHDNLWEMPTDHQFIQITSSDAASSDAASSDAASSDAASSDPNALAQKISDHISNLSVFKDQEREVSVVLTPLIPSLTTFELMLALVGLGILMLSWINFINLSIAQSLNRLGEVVIRKALGSSHRQLVGQFVLESLLINGTALLLTILFLWLSYSYFEQLTGNHLLPLFDNSLHINTLFLVSFVVGSILTSAYPSIFLVSKKVQGLGNLGKVIDRRGQGLRKGLVVAQFAISSVMIVGSYVIVSQMDYMISKDLGFNPTNKLIIKPPKDRGQGKLERMFTIKQELAKLSWVERITTSSTIPGQSYRQEAYFSLKGSDKEPLLYINAVDTSFVSTYGVKLLAGTNFLTTGGA